jgi:hypothetical protein
MKAYTQGYYTNNNYTILDLVKQNTNRHNLYLVISDDILLVHKSIDLKLTNNDVLLLNDNNIELYKEIDAIKISLNVYNMDTILNVCRCEWFINISGISVDKIYLIDNGKYFN